MRRYRHRTTGVTVRVADDRVMGREWEPLDTTGGPKPAPGDTECPAPAEPTAPTPDPDGPPPRAGRGASRAAWIAYAARVTDTDSAEFADWSREDIIDLVDRG